MSKRDLIERLSKFGSEQGVLFLFGCSIVVLVSAKAFALDISNYFEPENTTKIFQYSSRTESGLENMNTSEWSFEGRLVQMHGGLKSVDGKNKLTVTTHTKELKDFPTGYETYYVHEGNGYYSLSNDDNGKQVRSLILPPGVQVGQTWKGSDFWDEDTLDAVIDYSVPAGSFQDCLQISRINGDRTDLSQRVGERQHEVAIICPKVGLVSSTVTNIINAIHFKTVTTIELISIE